MKYTTLLTNIKRGLNVMYFITKESDKSVISDDVFDVGRISGSKRILYHNVTIDTDLTNNIEIKIEIIDELNEKLAFIKECEEILASRERILDIVKTEALNLRDKFSDERKTEITDVAGEVDIEDLIPKEQCVLTKTNNGYIKRMACDEYEAQNRGGRGIKGMTTREDDVVESMFTCLSHDWVMMFSNLGKVYRMKA
jgi:DNA gyrase/topoisomerase IV subunit A